MKKRTRNEDYQSKVRVGYGRMRQEKVAICSIVRNCRQNLKRNIPTIELIRSKFDKSLVVVVENDSIDGTKQVLADWSHSSPDVHIITEDLGVTTVPVAEGAVLPCFSRHRIELMASYRNKYLEFLDQQWSAATIVIVVDLDLAEISVDGIANTFGQAIPWDAVTSNSINANSFEPQYYDAYAFREVNDSQPQTEERIFTYQNLLSGFQRGMPMIKVASAFNGLCVYRAEAIRGLRYRCEPNSDMHVEATCEHITFHLDMSRQGFDRIYINPSQWVFYDARSGLPRRMMSSAKRILRFVVRELTSRHSG